MARWAAAAMSLCGILAGCGGPAAPPAARPPFPPPPEVGTVELTVAADWVTYHPDLPVDPGQGLGLVVESGGRMMLFEAGSDGPRLLDNLHRLGKDLERIEAVVLAHLTTGHWQGLPDLLAARPDLPVYLPEPPTEAVCEYAGKSGDSMPGRRPEPGADRPTSPDFRVADKPTEVIPGVFTSGAFETEDGHRGQSLIIHTPQGPVLVLGCGNPEPVVMAHRAEELTGRPVHMIIGGFLGHPGESPFHPRRQAAALRAMDARSVLLFHCTCGHTAAVDALEGAWGASCIRAGNGALIRFVPGADGAAVTRAPIVNPPPASREGASSVRPVRPSRTTGQTGFRPSATRSAWAALLAWERA